LAQDEEATKKYETNFKMFLKLLASIATSFGRNARCCVHPNRHKNQMIVYS
jgi:hypothetical protein